MQLLTTIKEYLQKSDTDYAILVNGNWGSGKTYFLKQTLSSAVSKIALDSSKKEHFELVYISLYGLSSSADLEKALFLELNPFWKKKVGKGLATLLAGIRDRLS